MVRVGIIDSGLTLPLSATVIAQRDFTGSNELTDRLGHGSRIANIIAHPMVELCSARVFHNVLSCTVSQVAQAIEWLISVDVKVINMSFGLIYDINALSVACAKALSHNIIMIAAAPAQGRPVYPSSYPGVVRATGDARCQPNEIAWLDSAQADFGGYPGDPGSLIAGASIGCASVTAAITKLLVGTPALTGDVLIKQLATAATYRGIENHSARVHYEYSR